MRLKWTKKLNIVIKKPLALVMCITLATALVACGDSDKTEEMIDEYINSSEPAGDDTVGYGNETGDGQDSTDGTDTGDEIKDTETQSDSSSDMSSTANEPSDTTTSAEPTTTVKPTTTAPTTAKPTTTAPTTAAPQVSVNYNVNISTPVASGTAVSNLNNYIIDYSNMQDGYVMVKSNTSAVAVVQIYLDSKSGTLLGQYILDSSNVYYAFPLTKGAATYCVRVLEQNASGKYSMKNDITQYAAISPETKAYIHPNMYVDFNANSKAVRLSCELVAGCTTDEQKVNAIHKYIVDNIDYDYDYASYVAANGLVGYMDAERCLTNKKGICGDYSVLFATMCRAQGIPCMVVEGYVTTSQQIYHAWNKVWLNGSWKFYDTTFDAGGGTGSSYIECYYY